MLEAVYTLFWVILFIGVIKYGGFFRNTPRVGFRTLAWLFLIKCFSGLAFILAYTFYFDPETADFLSFFQQGKLMFSAIHDNPLDYLRMLTGIGSGQEHLEVYYSEMGHWYRPWYSPLYNDNRLLIRFNALVHLFSFGYLHVHNVVLNFFSFAGLVGIYRFAAGFYPKERASWLLMGIVLMPSVLFWASGIIKEGLLMGVFGLWLFLVHQIFFQKKTGLMNMSALVFLTFVFTLLKPYVLFLFIPCLFAFYFSQVKKVKTLSLVFLSVIFVSGFLALGFGRLFPQYDIINLLVQKQNDSIIYSLHVEAGSIIEVRYLQARLTDIAAFIPRALLNVFSRPHLLDSPSPLVIMSAAENLLIKFITLVILIKAIKNKGLPPIAWMGLLFTLILFTFVGISTQVYGSLVRYKVPALPFLWIAVVSVSDTKKIEQWPAVKRLIHFSEKAKNKFQKNITLRKKSTS